MEARSRSARRDAPEASPSRERRYVKPGERVRVELPHSEVCIYMRVAGKVMTVEVTERETAQLLRDDGSHFSFPILLGEAGLYRDDKGIYCYPAKARVGRE